MALRSFWSRPFVPSFPRSRRAARPGYGSACSDWFTASAEWLEILAIDLQDTPAFSAVRFAAMALSFVFLCEFGRKTLGKLQRKGPGRWIYVPLLALAASGALGGTASLQATTRYALALTGGLWAAWAMVPDGQEGRTQPRAPGRGRDRLGRIRRCGGCHCFASAVLSRLGPQYRLVPFGVRRTHPACQRRVGRAHCDCPVDVLGTLAADRPVGSGKQERRTFRLRPGHHACRYAGGRMAVRRVRQRLVRRRSARHSSGSGGDGGSRVHPGARSPP